MRLSCSIYFFSDIISLIFKKHYTDAYKKPIKISTRISSILNYNYSAQIPTWPTAETIVSVVKLKCGFKQQLCF